jgi:hypothetical protein
MKEILPHISLAATVIYCTIAKAHCKCMWADQSTSDSSHHGEILGGVMMQLILNAAASKCHGAIPLAAVDCDNNKIVSHGNEPFCPFPTNQSQADILCVFKNLVAAQPFHVWYKYIQSHANDTKRWQDCLLKELNNIKVDSLAKKALMAAHSTGKCIKSPFSNEQIWISMGGERWWVPWGPNWEEFCGWSTVKKYLHKKGLFHMLIMTLSGG